MRLILVRHALPFRALPTSVGGPAVGGPAVGEDPAAGGGAVPGPAAMPGNGADPGLTELGHRQAARVVDALAGEPVTAIYSSIGYWFTQSRMQSYRRLWEIEFSFSRCS